MVQAIRFKDSEVLRNEIRMRKYGIGRNVEKIEGNNINDSKEL